MAHPFNIHNHGVAAIIPKSHHHAPPADSIILKLTIQITLITVKINHLPNLYSITNSLSRRMTLDFDFRILENESRLHQTLAPHLNGLGVKIGSINYNNLICEIIECELRMADQVVNRGNKCVVLPLLANVNTRSIERNYDDGTRRDLEESEADLERRNYDMVAAKGSSIQEMFKKKVRVEDDEIDCMVCLDKIKVGKFGSRMLCSHIFHGYCIFKWLKQSHSCPICRYKMPTND